MDKFTDILYNYVELDEIPDNARFRDDLGLSSFDTVCLISEIKKALNKQLEPADFILHKTVGEMRTYLASLT